VGAESRNSLREDLEPGLGAEGEQDTLVRDTLFISETSAIVQWCWQGNLSLVHSP
jgi:hypothetical protein